MIYLREFLIEIQSKIAGIVRDLGISTFEIKLNTARQKKQTKTTQLIRDRFLKQGKFEWQKDIHFKTEKSICRQRV